MEGKTLNETLVNSYMTEFDKAGANEIVLLFDHLVPGPKPLRATAWKQPNNLGAQAQFRLRLQLHSEISPTDVKFRGFQTKRAEELNEDWN